MAEDKLLVRKGGLVPEDRARSTKVECLGSPCGAKAERSEGLVRKGGLEPPRYCYRQPLKLRVGDPLFRRDRRAAAVIASEIERRLGLRSTDHSRAGQSASRAHDSSRPFR